MPPIIPSQAPAKVEVKGVIVTVPDGSDECKKSQRDQKIKIQTTN